MADLAASIALRNKNNVWISDHMVLNCYCCKAQFTILKRKHHCRNCGNVFCYNCLDFIVIPDFITDRPDRADCWNISYYIPMFASTEKEKVCKQCYNIIKEKMDAYDRIVEIFKNPIPIDKIKEMPDSAFDVKNHYFDHLRNIQYYLPNHCYNDNDKKILKVNACYFSRHSKYLVHLIKSIEWKSTKLSTKSIKAYSTQSSIQNMSSTDIAEKLKLIIDVINGPKTKECRELFCTRTCNEQLSCDDCVNILYTHVHDLPNQLIEYLFGIVSNSPEQVIICHLSFFVNIIKENNTNKPLRTILFNMLSKSAKLIYQTYWFLTNAKETANATEMLNIKIFIEMFDGKLVRQMHSEYMFYVGLIKHLDNPVLYLSEFDKCKPISLPYEPNFKLVNVDLNNIIVKSSYTKPVIISFEIKEFENVLIEDNTDTDNDYSNGTEVIRLLFKKESVMNDVTVLNLMTLSDMILKDTLSKNFGVIVYPTMPLTAKSGMIEIVDKAETVHAITGTNTTILQHIIERNNDKIVGDVLDKYMHSLVSYTLHSYFIGLGDRHLQNIMITDDGAIFHIDFGFILGTDAYPLTAGDIKLNSDMLDVIGGSDSRRHNTYLELCSAGVVILRKYFTMFFILFSQNTDFDKKHIENFVMSRFQPRQVDSTVIEELLSVIKKSNNAYPDYIRDFLHYHSQERTVQNGLTKAFSNMVGVVKSFSNSNT